MSAHLIASIHTHAVPTGKATCASDKVLTAPADSGGGLWGPASHYYYYLPTDKSQKKEDGPISPVAQSTLKQTTDERH